MTAQERFEAWWDKEELNGLATDKMLTHKLPMKIAYLAAEKAVWEYAALFIRNYPQTHDPKLSKKLVAIAEHFECLAQEVR